MMSGKAGVPMATHVAVFSTDARELFAASVFWLTHETASALIDLGVAAGIFLGLSTMRRLLAPAKRIAAAPIGWGSITRRVTGRTKDFFLAALSLELVSTYIGAPEMLQRGFTFAFTIATTLQGAIWLRAAAIALIERRAAQHGDASQAASAIEVVRLLLTAVIWGVTFIIVLDDLGVNVTGLVAGLGVGGIAIGLAAQGIFSDLFAALSIIFDRPFGRGDQINYGDTWGAVENIGLKTTRIRSLTGEQIVISNSNLLAKELRNFARLERRRVTLKVGIVYQISADQAAGLPEVFREVVEADARCTLVRSALTNFGASSLDFEIQFDVATESYDEMYQQRHRIMIGVIRRFAELKINFAYPTTVLFPAAPDGRAIDPRETAIVSTSMGSMASAGATPDAVRATERV